MTKGNNQLAVLPERTEELLNEIWASPHGWTPFNFGRLCFTLGFPRNRNPFTKKGDPTAIKAWENGHDAEYGNLLVESNRDWASAKRRYGLEFDTYH
jgi:hypothetical protein